MKNSLSLLIFENSQSIEFNSKIDETLIIYESFLDENFCEKNEIMYPFDHILLNTLQHDSKNKRMSRDGKVPYLLSGCLAILKYEPCVLCSMSLLHSRIDAVIFFNENTAAGALGSTCYLHSMEALNHRFPVYRVNFGSNK